MSAFVLTIGLFLAPAAAAEIDLSIETGRVSSADPQMALVGGESGIPTVGLRGAASVTPWLDVGGSVHHGVTGAEISMRLPSGHAPPPLHTALTLDRLGAAARFRWTARPWLVPYAQTEIYGMRGRLRMDDDIERADNPNQLKQSALTAGGELTAGVELLPIRIRRALRLGLHIDAGYGAALPLNFAGAPEGAAEQMELGSLKTGGLALHMGLDARF